MRKAGIKVQSYNVMNHIGHPDVLISGPEGQGMFIEIKHMPVPRFDKMVRPNLSRPQLTWLELWDRHPVPTGILTAFSKNDIMYGYCVIPTSRWKELRSADIHTFKVLALWEDGYPEYEDVWRMINMKG